MGSAVVSTTPKLTTLLLKFIYFSLFLSPFMLYPYAAGGYFDQEKMMQKT